MPSFKYIGHSGETIVGMTPTDLTAEEYDALDYDHQQAVLINKGSDGGPLYVEVHAEVAPADMMPSPEPAPELAPEPPAAPDLNLPLDEAPAEGAN